MRSSLKYIISLLALVLLSGCENTESPDSSRFHAYPVEIPTRENQLQRLENEMFDLLIIGGGATGSGIALDGVTRGLSVALVEGDDFGSGTSSKSTKLVHGGVRYLEKAVFNLDRGQYNLVIDALRERANFLNSAPHLTRTLPIIIPIYSWYKIPYYYLGMKMYDCLAGSANLKSSYFITPAKALKEFPLLNKEGLWGAIVYHDGQFNDARMNVTIAMTAVSYGACVANHVEVVELLKDNDRVIGAKVRNVLDDTEFNILAKVVVNATGAGIDKIRLKDDPDAEPILAPSSGSHIVLDYEKFSTRMGLLIPQTEDGRVLFMLPWQSSMIAGTTDKATDPSLVPQDS